jgi:hypothetical protein
MAERFTCPQGHQWEDANWTGTQRNLCLYCGAEPAAPTAIASAETSRPASKPPRADEDLPSVLAAEPSRPAQPKSKRGPGAFAVLGCLMAFVAVGAFIIGGSGWYYYNTRQFELARARGVAENALYRDYKQGWRIESEKITPFLTEAVFEGRGTESGIANTERKFTIVVAKKSGGKWEIDR